MTTSPDILVAGAGPTGLALALHAHDNGATVRVVDRRAEAFRPSRALVVHARTLEVLRPLGVVDELLAMADTTPRARLHLGSREVSASLTGFGWTDTPYPHLSVIRQADVEAVLARALADRGVPVERGTEVAGFDSVAVTLSGPQGIEPVTCGYLAGCDGADSTVRRSLRVPWHGGYYREEVVLADLELAGGLTPGVAHVAVGRRGLLFLFAAGEHATWRLLATRPAVPGHGPVRVDGLQRLLDDIGLPVQITELAWSTRIRLQHRLAGAYRAGRVFLAGDAAHAHSPAGAQGMNTGIQDAANLGWKLAYAPSAGDPESLMDSYERERRPIARRVVMLTHLLFRAEASTDPVSSFLRGTLGPLAAPALPLVLCAHRPLSAAARLLSQLDTAYPVSPVAREDSPLPSGGARAGTRLADATVTCDDRRVRLHELAAEPGFTVLLDRDAPSAPSSLRAYRLSDRSGTGVRVIRPDGYIGYRSAVADPRRLGGWLGRVGAVPCRSP